MLVVEYDFQLRCPDSAIAEGGTLCAGAGPRIADESRPRRHALWWDNQTSERAWFSLGGDPMTALARLGRGMIDT